MATNFEKRPNVCDSCGSKRIVPVVDGYLDDERHVLSLQRKIFHRGCFAMAQGDPLWGCVDCGQPISDADFAWNDSNDETMIEYFQAVESAFRSYCEISHEEHDVLRGIRLLRGMLKRKFSQELVELTFLLKPNGTSFDIIEQTAESKNVESHKLLDADRFASILAAAKASNSKFQCRIGRHEETFEVGFEEGVVRLRPVKNRE